VSDLDDLRHRYATDARQALPPILDAVASSLGIDDDAQREALGEALARAYQAGASAGQAEIMAQAVEQGFDININRPGAPDSDGSA